jgi:hypothetical protein
MDVLSLYIHFDIPPAKPGSIFVILASRFSGLPGPQKPALFNRRKSRLHADNPLKTILFDLDGTLINSCQPISYRFSKTFAKSPGATCLPGNWPRASASPRRKSCLLRRAGADPCHGGAPQRADAPERRRHHLLPGVPDALRTCAPPG